ncbi:hypothetical protein [Paenibacillus sp. FSL W7-1287]|uniref:hypothetical protein n=1 Tax=Paenibacillus sp. FSL W7-1287 TaxID=2954538 RepID=UPI0030F823CF
MLLLIALLVILGLLLYIFLKPRAIGKSHTISSSEQSLDIKSTASYSEAKRNG